MARKKVVTTTVDDDAAAGDTELLPVGVADADEDLAADRDMVDELKTLAGDDGVKWTVHKIATKPGDKSGWCADYQTGELSLQGIRDTFGGGRYKIRGTRLSGGQYVASRTLEIVDMPKAEIAPGAQGGQDIAAILAAVKPGTDAGMMPLLLEMIKSNTQQMTALFQGMNNRPAEKQTSAMELVTLIKALQPDKGDEKSGVDMLLEGLRLGRELGGGGGGADWMDLARTGLEAIKPAIEAQAQARGAAPAALPAPVQAALPNPHPAAAPAPPGQPQPAGADPMIQQLNWLRSQVNLLVGQAAKHAAGKGGDPELYAEIMLDNLPAFITPEALLERISAPDALTQLASIDARVNQFVPWFTQFRQAVMDFFIEDETPGEEPPAEGAPPH